MNTTNQISWVAVLDDNSNANESQVDFNKIQGRVKMLGLKQGSNTSWLPYVGTDYKTGKMGSNYVGTSEIIEEGRWASCVCTKGEKSILIRLRLFSNGTLSTEIESVNK